MVFFKYSLKIHCFRKIIVKLGRNRLYHCSQREEKNLPLHLLTPHAWSCPCAHGHLGFTWWYCVKQNVWRRLVQVSTAGVEDCLPWWWPRLRAWHSGQGQIAIYCERLIDADIPSAISSRSAGAVSERIARTTTDSNSYPLSPSAGRTLRDHQLGNGQESEVVIH